MPSKSSRARRPRRAERRPAHGFVAHYSSGGAARQDDIKNISSTGLYLLTEERWLPGTVIPVTLQMQSPLKEISERQITVQAKTVLWGEDGVGFSFVLPDDPNARPWKFLLRMRQSNRSRMVFWTLHALPTLSPSLVDYRRKERKKIAQLVDDEWTKARVANIVQILLKAESLLPADFSAESIGARPGLVVKVLQYGSWADEGWIQQMWAGLLATTCSMDGDDGSNEFFIDLFSKLADVHVCIFTYACMRTTNLQATSGSTSSEPLICTREELMEVTGSRELLRIERDLEHLYDLGLLERAPQPRQIRHIMRRISHPAPWDCSCTRAATRGPLRIRIPESLPAPSAL